MTMIVEIVGWAGAGLILAAYTLLSLRRIEAESLIYQGLNVVGSAGFVVNGRAHGALPSVGLNLLWLLVGGWALARIARAGCATCNEAWPARPFDGRPPALRAQPPQHAPATRHPPGPPPPRYARRRRDRG